jgi:uncharacterized protein YecE (DUF72 family)
MLPSMFASKLPSPRVLSSEQRRIRVGIGGWNFEPWRKSFYPPDVKVADELAYASRQMTAIEINGTFYRLQKPAVYAKWHDATPDDFVFSMKAPRFITQRKVLAEGARGIDGLLASGIAELKHKLGPIVWQLTPNQGFDARDLRGFLRSLPQVAGQLPLRHALNVRHASFRCAEFIEIAREFNVAVVFEDDAEFPAVAEITADFVYARLRRSTSSETTGYPPSSIATWAARAREWRDGHQPQGLPYIVGAKAAHHEPRDVFVFFINGAKERAPAAARALIAELRE